MQYQTEGQRLPVAYKTITSIFFWGRTVSLLSVFSLTLVDLLLQQTLQMLSSGIIELICACFCNDTWATYYKGKKTTARKENLVHIRVHLKMINFNGGSIVYTFFSVRLGSHCLSICLDWQFWKLMVLLQLWWISFTDILECDRKIPFLETCHIVSLPTSKNCMCIRDRYFYQYVVGILRLMRQILRQNTLLYSYLFSTDNAREDCFMCRESDNLL